MLHCQVHSLVGRRAGKLEPRYAGPSRVLAKVGLVACRLQLLHGALLHDVFHVGLRKSFCGDPSTATSTLPPINQLSRGDWFILVTWEGMNEANATWELVADFKQAYLEFQLEAELFPEDGRDVMVGTTYLCRDKSKSG